ncbi:MAG TPA: B12-binding domain-containing radical SAM protein [Bacteroidales bacterium]|nr:B12-binding domain-containing radical SAM protein [Bacteroidales bacterium]
MNILLVYPQYPDTYWSFNHALKFVSKKVANIPIGILTVSSLLPGDWNRKLADLNVSKLKDEDITWADYVFISAMSVQSASVKQVLELCSRLRTPVVAGGSLFTEEPGQYPGVDHLVLNEAEITLPLFLSDLEKGTPKRIYSTDGFADMTKSPMPDYSLLKLSKYMTAGIQYSRGCPFDCEFCDITALFGRRVRTKTPVQILAELDQLVRIGWRSSVFFVDDNFIGHRQKLKKELLPAMIDWAEANNHPFTFLTEASIDLSDDEELMDLMVRAGFTKVFVGIETPEESCLLECNKNQNKGRDLINSVMTLQQRGLEVMAGFIVGFDHDPPNIFQRQIDFIGRSGIITAMVGLLNAPRLSKLYRRMSAEGRLTDKFTGDNTNYSLNFVPVMNMDELMNGYQKIISEIYSSKVYYKRVLMFLKNYNPRFRDRLSFTRVTALFKSILYLGILKNKRRYFWKLVLWSIFNKPRAFPLAVTYSIYGYHFRKVFKNVS